MKKIRIDDLLYLISLCMHSFRLAVKNKNKNRQALLYTIFGRMKSLNSSPNLKTFVNKISKCNIVILGWVFTSCLVIRE